jgi:hypothetical protein
MLLFSIWKWLFKYMCYVVLPGFVTMGFMALLYFVLLLKDPPPSNGTSSARSPRKLLAQYMNRRVHALQPEEQQAETKEDVAIAGSRDADRIALLIATTITPGRLLSLSVAEEAILAQGRLLKTAVEAVHCRPLASPLPGVSIHTCVVEARDLAYLKATGTVAGPPEALLAYRWDTQLWTEAVLLEEPNCRHLVATVSYGLPPPVLPRQFVTRVVWEAEADGFLIVVVPTLHPLRPLNASHVRK